MTEKISEKSARIDKIARLKSKVLSTIDEYMSTNKEHLQEAEHFDDRLFDELIEECFIMAKLKEYFEQEHLFEGVEAMCEDADKVVYIVSTYNLDILLDEDFDFVLNFIVRAINDDVFAMLNERYFGYNFISIIEQMVYEDKHRQED